MKAKKAPETEDLAGIKKLVSEIRKEQQKIDRHEGDAVGAHIRLAHHLAELRALAKRTWGQQLKTIGISPRVASRYLKIAQNWPSEIGLNESDLLSRIPLDLLKLEWLCRVPLAELGALLEKLDCKKATRPQVVAAVREALGEVPPDKDEHNAEQFAQRFLRRTFRMVGRLREMFPDREEENRVRELLRAGLIGGQEALEVRSGGDTRQ